ncbi:MULTISPECIES: sporulation-delaying protein SdpB family protein [Bacillales]|jgi:antimicrobial peptide system SdpB family protein|uniref:HTTM domain-containing protein n=1 Tax=Brevibacillus aydinogluensis TaxID=927786 RepID=A0AA48MCU9_9BACL|nr:MULTISPECIES: sporulation-delaying protein SdpB family protein [Bacillales]REK66710.1 MAG: hypothetical protein DF221_02240 [Brevibacillus sp.]MBR8660062.1 hypothetical protein [Brevibacillus sp. NL20B1]MDT3417775.1 antimicrobial peptide system SdpB family protein [Brevibacillus aydinogluensis]NNV02199.1 hypothetical protein [Brevibacillus sp. MCWH]UFJ62877.1 hypothetical protein IRT44_09100 [Anoxybacillus sediminis]
MFEKLGSFAYNLALTQNPWTNVYGLARSLMALSTALTLAVNDAHTFFRPSSGMDVYPTCVNTISLFCTVPNDYFYLDMVRWIAVVLLLIVASGWRPRITGVIHWWICYSFNVSAITLDGGDQVAAVFTFLLLPITLTDSRKWHWQKAHEPQVVSDHVIIRRIIALVTFFAIRLQVAIIYFHSSVAKMFESTWLNGTSVYYYLRDPMLGLPSFFLQLVNPILTSPAVVLPTWGTLVLQVCLFGALFAPKKYWKYFLIAALLMHEVIAVMLGLISFSMIMSAVLILYLRPVEQEFTSLHRIRLFKKETSPTQKDYHLSPQQVKGA